MLNWKVVVTAIILLGIIAFFISTQNPVQEFFKFVQEKIDSIFGHTVAEERNISFSLTAEYGNISFEDDVNITINPIIFSADINKMNIETSDTVIMEFSGSGRISGMNLSLDGITNNIKISNSSMVFNRASLKSEAAFTELTIGKLELKELKLKKGSLLIKGTETKFSDSIEISNLEGRFVFNATTTDVYEIKIEGLASRIFIPEADMLIK